MTAVLVAVGAAVGSLVRFLAGHYGDKRLPWGTIVVNVAGSFVVGLVSGAGLGERASIALGTGFCGGLTTYSAFAVQTHRSDVRRGSLIVALTLLPALLACAFGYALTA